ELVREGGILTYITCSPHVDETLAQVEKLLKTGKVELLDTVALGEALAPESLNVPDAAGRIKKYPGRTLQLWEHRNGTDLMFIAAMKKVEKPTSAR
ncbi:MAG: 16S rRNA methyltransferase, partial [Actinomycetaceae bacterium UMB1218B]|nr:16S rRNA methyltransferase [Actinomycetaceae bacterium UMB1218B]